MASSTLAAPTKSSTARFPIGAKLDYFRASQVTWTEYEQLIRFFDGRRSVRLTYDRGELEYMTISHRHGTLNASLDRLLGILFEEFQLRYKAGGEMTFRREDLDRGIEPDDCYWIKQVDRVLGKEELDFQTDPPPDLVLEVDLSESLMKRLAILAGLKVPEVLWYRPNDLRSGLLQADGSYTWSAVSPLFPNLQLADLARFVEESMKIDHLTLMQQFRAWVRSQLGQST